VKPTRRQLVAAAAGSAAAIRALAQSAPAASGSAAASASSTAAAALPRDFGKEARDAVQRNADILAKFEIPMSTEPAFHFKA
jgi:hypothetical protein